MVILDGSVFHALLSNLDSTSYFGLVLLATNSAALTLSPADCAYMVVENTVCTIDNTVCRVEFEICGIENEIGEQLEKALVLYADLSFMSCFTTRIIFFI